MYSLNFSSAIGAAFEVGITKSLDYKAAQREKGGDFDIRGGVNLPRIQKLFGMPSSMSIADLKVSDSVGNTESFYSKVMKEIGINITSQTSDPISNFLNKNINIVVTVCDNADKVCPVFSGKVERIHWSIKDPFKGWGSDPDDLDNFTRTRDDLYERIKNFLINRSG